MKKINKRKIRKNPDFRKQLDLLEGKNVTVSDYNQKIAVIGPLYRLRIENKIIYSVTIDQNDQGGSARFNPNDVLEIQDKFILLNNKLNEHYYGYPD